MSSSAHWSTVPVNLADWRHQFGADLPFLIVQLPNFGVLPRAPTESGWAEIREAQRLAVEHDAHAALAVTIDIGDPHNLHSTNKQDVAARLARAARRLIYGESTLTAGPAPVRATLEAGAGTGPDTDRDAGRDTEQGWRAAANARNREVRVDFQGVDSELIAYSHATPIGFELCGAAPGSCRFAEARIQNTQILLPLPPDSTPPLRVRYCWADSPVCTLADRSGLPAVPFELPISQGVP